MFPLFVSLPQVIASPLPPLLLHGYIKEGEQSLGPDSHLTPQATVRHTRLNGKKRPFDLRLFCSAARWRHLPVLSG